jgi:hypothetical protein
MTLLKSSIHLSGKGTRYLEEQRTLNYGVIKCKDTASVSLLHVWCL